MKKILLAAVILFGSGAQNAIAYTECPRTVKKVWSTLSGDIVWVCFEEYNRCISITLNNAGQGGLDRVYAAALTALSSKNKFWTRYNNDNVECSTTSPYESIQGYWVENSN